MKAVIALAGAAALGFAAPAAAQDFGFEQAWKTGGFANPESVLYVDALDAFLVSNIAGGVPLEEDGDGFISVLGLDGAIETLRFAEGLDAPKGMAAANGTLFVSDIDELVAIDLETGDVVARHAVEGAEFLNDVTIGPDGTVLVSDMGTGRIHALVDGEMTLWSDDARLASDAGSVNGLLAETDRLLAYVGDTLWAIDWETRDFSQVADGLGSGDGMVPDGEGGYVLTNWAGRIFHLDADGAVRTISDTRLMGVNSADPGYAPQAGLFAIPTFFDNAVMAFGRAE
ncbi:ATP-binding protein [Marinicauda salina]|uniref:ATP-binding protein n=1 Tax=Marinicauda salina TaxID=2135793 RepID=A0A2U2BWQ8_9PROT|nr:SMP-30/gluconolactonase/LRE family protein [Marinicauda salina]PWE18456.1 ATP-binding protein [Marinicauda salina]